MTDIEALKREADTMTGETSIYNLGWNAAIDHLIAQGWGPREGYAVTMDQFGMFRKLDGSKWLVGEEADMTNVTIVGTLQSGATMKPVIDWGWQDISTAPKDGTPVNLWDSHGNYWPDCWWEPAQEYIHDGRWNVISHGEGGHSYPLDTPDFNPTHWQPRPLGPNGETAK